MCRQAAHRAVYRGERIRATDQPLRLAYADPPYPGKARLYRDHPDYAGEVDHRALLSQLATFDGWALSTSAQALPWVLGTAVDLGLRPKVAAWVRGRPRPHPTARVRNVWEPVVYQPARAMPRAGHDVWDALSDVASRRRQTLPGAVIGMKPPAVCYWIFDLLGASRGDTLADLFPGSGMVSWCWDQYQGHAPEGVPGQLLMPYARPAVAAETVPGASEALGGTAP